MDAGRSLGYKPKEIAQITSAKVYQDAYPEVLNRIKALGPTADEGMIRGVIESVLNTKNVDGTIYGAANHPKTVELILNQVLGAYGKPLGSPPSTDTGGTGVGGGGKTKPPAAPFTASTPEMQRLAADAAAINKDRARGRYAGSPRTATTPVSKMGEDEAIQVMSTTQAGSPQWKAAAARIEQLQKQSGAKIDSKGAPVYSQSNIPHMTVEQLQYVLMSAPKGGTFYTKAQAELRKRGQYTG
jgi:hypothetical protein